VATETLIPLSLATTSKRSNHEPSAATDGIRVHRSKGLSILVGLYIVEKFGSLGPPSGANGTRKVCINPNLCPDWCGW
jgi:hypothetical protein